jgi:hypothetical protein
LTNTPSLTRGNPVHVTIIVRRSPELEPSVACRQEQGRSTDKGPRYQGRPFIDKAACRSRSRDPVTYVLEAIRTRWTSETSLRVRLQFVGQLPDGSPAIRDYLPIGNLTSRGQVSGFVIAEFGSHTELGARQDVKLNGEYGLVHSEN